MANFDPHNPEESLTSHKDPQEGGKNTSLATPSGAVSYTHLTLPTKRIV